MRTGFATKKVIVSAGYAAITPQAPVNVVDGDGSAVIVGLVALAALIVAGRRRGPAA